MRRYRDYTAAEIARILEVSLGTITRWRKEGLRSIDDRRPYLYAGGELVRFLQQKNKPRQPMEAGQIFCVACKRAHRPAGGEARVEPRSDTTGDLVGRCPSCGRRNFRRVRLRELAVKAGDLILRYEDGSVPISSNCNHPHIVGSEADPK